MDLYLRKIIHAQARDNYRVILKDDGDEIEIDSIGIQHGTGATSFWSWGIDIGLGWPHLLPVTSPPGSGLSQR
jgi:hypothetical protein